jgi:hypothetical protein
MEPSLCVDETLKHDDDDCSIVEGFLKKRSRSRFSKGRNWQERYFVLKHGSISWFKIRSEVSYSFDKISKAEMGKFELLEKNLMAYRFEVFFVDQLQPNLLMAAPSHSEALSLVECFTTHHLKHTSSCSGTVFVLNGSVWEEKQLFFRDNCCVLQTRKKCDVFQLQGASVEIDPTNTSRLLLKTENDSLSIECQSEDQCKVWFSHIQSAIEFEASLDIEALDNAIQIELRDVLRSVIEKNEHAGKAYTPIVQGKKTLVVSVDGGGIRGIIPCVILERILDEFPQLFAQIQVVSGSSIGSMIAMGMAFNYHPRLIAELMVLTANAIFSERRARIPVLHARWSNRCLSILCAEMFQKKTLLDAQKKIVASALKLDNLSSDDSMRSSEVHVFHNLDAESGKELASDVVMRSSAAPSYFPAWQGYVDGGMFAPDPSSLCLSFVLSPFLMDVPVRDVVMISISTGKFLEYFDHPTHDWGYLQWASKLQSALWSGMISKSQLCTKQLLGESLLRIDPVLDHQVKLDVPSAIPQLIQVASDHDLTEAFAWIRKNLSV